MKIGIDLLWVRPGKNGGTESYIRNILDGIDLYGSIENQYYLYISNDNKESFRKYFNNPIFLKRECSVFTSNQIKRIVWESLHIKKMVQNDKLDIWFMPVYSKPLFVNLKIPCITVIHDLQALHFPEYFSVIRNVFFRISWWNDCKTSSKIITISKFCKQDIIDHLSISGEKVDVIYNPIIILQDKFDFNKLSEKYGIRDKNYYYTVSAIAKHKNIVTLLRMMKKLKDQGINKKLVITGVNVNANKEIKEYIKTYKLDDIVTFTGYISNEVRDSLYQHCEVFLFPSIFEGFGMPPVEALMRGVPVVTTKMSSIYEVTQGKCVYVNDPFNENEWMEKINRVKCFPRTIYRFKEYELKSVIKRYEKVFIKTYNLVS